MGPAPMNLFGQLGNGVVHFHLIEIKRDHAGDAVFSDDACLGEAIEGHQSDGDVFAGGIEIHAEGGVFRIAQHRPAGPAKAAARSAEATAASPETSRAAAE